MIEFLTAYRQEDILGIVAWTIAHKGRLCVGGECMHIHASSILLRPDNESRNVSACGWVCGTIDTGMHSLDTACVCLCVFVCIQ